MMRPSFAVFAIALISVSAGGQQTVTQPVITAPPAAAATATPPPAAPQDIAPPTDSTSYLIGPEDTLQVTVWKQPENSGTFPVRPDGMISISLIGDVQASGLTPSELGKSITERLKKFIREPNVTVILMSVHPKSVYLNGEVNHVGPVTLTPGMTVLQAISTAGGLTPYANKKRVYILRGQDGKQKKILFNYTKAIKDGDQQGVSLQPGDTIVIP